MTPEDPHIDDSPAFREMQADAKRTPMERFQHANGIKPDPCPIETQEPAGPSKETLRAAMEMQHAFMPCECSPNIVAPICPVHGTLLKFEGRFYDRRTLEPADPSAGTTVKFRDLAIANPPFQVKGELLSPEARYLSLLADRERLREELADLRERAEFYQSTAKVCREDALTNARRAEREHAARLRFDAALAAVVGASTRLELLDFKRTIHAHYGNHDDRACIEAAVDLLLEFRPEPQPAP